MYMYCTYIDEVTGVSLLNVVEDGSFVEVTEGCHIFDSIDASLVHGHHIVVSELSSLIRGSLHAWTGVHGRVSNKR